MATTTSAKTTPDSSADTAAGGTGAAAGPGAEVRVWQPLGLPIVYEYRRGRGKKRYSSGAKTPQVLERGVSRSVERLAQSVADGLGRYRSRRDRSARRKKDGAIKDFVRNVGRGAEKALRTGAKAPTDLTRRMTSKRLRRVSRMVVPAPPFFFVRL
jgi:hypothetical protein